MGLNKNYLGQPKCMANRVLIIGALGQDGTHMRDLLLSKGYDVYGVVSPNTPISRIDRVKTFAADFLNMDVLRHTLASVRPQMVFNFAGISNVFSPWEGLDGILNTNTKIPQNILEVIAKEFPNIHFLQSSSCLRFGMDKSGYQDESTPDAPIYPYGASKAYADHLVRMYREEFGIYACSAIFYNHESPLRGDRFFSKKITNAAKTRTKIKVGDLDAQRDMGYCGDFMEAAYLMMTQDTPEDYVIGTGNLISMREFADKAFTLVGLDYRDYLEIDESFKRKDSEVLRANITKIKTNLGWEPKTSIDELIKIMMQ